MVKLLGILSQAGNLSGMIRFCSKSDPLWSVEWGYILLKTSIAADRSKNWWGMMTRCTSFVPIGNPKKLWMVHNLPKIFAELRRGLVFYQKLGPIGFFIFSSNPLEIELCRWPTPNGANSMAQVNKVKRPDQQKDCAAHGAAVLCTVRYHAVFFSKHGFRWRMVWAAILVLVMFAIFAISLFCTIGDKFMNAYEVCDSDEW